MRNFVRQILRVSRSCTTAASCTRDIKGANISSTTRAASRSRTLASRKRSSRNWSWRPTKLRVRAGVVGRRGRVCRAVFWMAPEVVKQTSYTIKADIWSLGCLVVEMMISGTHPWAELNQMQALFQIGMGRKTELADEFSSNECRDFLEKDV